MTKKKTTKVKQPSLKEWAAYAKKLNKWLATAKEDSGGNPTPPPPPPPGTGG